MNNVKNKINKLDFAGCISLYKELLKIQKGHPMIDLVFDKMEEIDIKLFDKFLDGNITLEDLV